ncbi:hypothetical protein EVX99_23075, partial [Citrobacter koseri]
MPDTSAVACLKRLSPHCHSHERAVVPFSPINPGQGYVTKWPAFYAGCGRINADGNRCRQLH